ncbi:MAG: hypothetical protein FWE29_03825 [Defluviitaleaceae bacterium]|nr:hypothetical protein [Defluviitaleaceae bacterium]
MLTYFVIIPVLISVFLFVFSGARSARIIAALFQSALVAFTFYLFMISRYETVYTVVGEFDGFLGIILRADNLAAVFTLLCTFIFLLVTLYSINERNSRTFWFLLFLLEASLIGLFLTRDFFNTFVLVEVGTVVVTILLMYDRERRNMLPGMTFLMINIIVMQLYLFGMGYLYMLTGTLDMYGVKYAISGIDRSNLILPYALIMTAIASKCSLLPLVTWLPKVNSMPGARSSIAALMSGLHVKSGVYMFIRFQEVFEPIAAQEFFMIIGIITGIAGVVLSLAQKDIKLILAYSTIAQIGLIMIGLNMDYEYAFYGSLFHIVNHAIFKTSLFMCTSMVIMRYRTKNIDEIRGLWNTNRTVAIATILAIFGIVGMPLFNGSVSKYFMMGGVDGLLEWTMIIINLGTILICLKYSAMFFGKPNRELREVTTDWCRQTAVMLFGIVCFVLGIFGEAFKNFAFNLEMHVDALGYLEKVGVFAASLVAGLLITKFVLRDGKILSSLRNLDMKFTTICASLGLFFALTVIVTGIF